MIMINHILQIMDVRKHIQKLYKKEIFKVLLIYLKKKQKKQKKDLNYNKQPKEIKRKLYVSHKNGLKEIFQNF